VGVVLYDGGATATKGMTFWHAGGEALENSDDVSTDPGGLGYNLETKVGGLVSAWINCLG